MTDAQSHADDEPGDPGTPELEDAICVRVREWIRRAAPNLEHSKLDIATLTIRLHDPGWDDDDTPMLTASFDETSSSDDVDGRVTRKDSGK